MGRDGQARPPSRPADGPVDALLEGREPGLVGADLAEDARTHARVPDTGLDLPDAPVGATEAVGSVGRTLLWNLISNPFGGTVYPVNPKRSHVLGIRAYPSIGAIPEPVDLAVIVTPAPTVPTQIVKSWVMEVTSPRTRSDVPGPLRALAASPSRCQTCKVRGI